MLPYDTLHLTEMSRSYDKTTNSEGVVRGTYATNETNAIDRSIIRMMLALPDLIDQRGADVFCHVYVLPSDTFQSFIVVPSWHTCLWCMNARASD
jgi:hypothetical protein